MRTMERNKQTAYIASRTDISDDYGKPTYGKPFVFRENLAPVDSELEITEYGERCKNMLKSITSRKKWSSIKAGDVAYLDGTNPFNEKVNGSSANYKVEAVRTYLTTITIYFEMK